MTTFDTICEVMNDNLDIAIDTIEENSTLESLGVDSLDMVELICELEERCEVEIGEPENIETIGQLADYIDSLR